MTPLEEKYFHLVRQHLSPEMVKQEMRDVIHPYYGHCHHATIALYDALGGKETGYKVRKAIDPDNLIHYWLESPTGEIIDPTAEQYSDLGKPFPYAHQTHKGVSYRRTNASKQLLARIAPHKVSPKAPSLKP